MNTFPIEKAFQKLGISCIFNSTNARYTRSTPFEINIRTIEGKETFIFRYLSSLQDKIEFQVLDIQPQIKHLLLLVRTTQIGGNVTKEKFLCGFDERHWFSAAVTSDTQTVAAALHNLKPPALRNSKVKRTKVNKRHTKEWIRQGEWFFIPDETFDPGKNPIIHKKEPISKGRGSKPHICDELIRIGGQTVYVSGSNILTESEYRSWRVQNPTARDNYTLRVRNARVYVRGKVRHPDHATVTLPTWYSVQLNGEIVSNNLGFLD